MDQSAQQYAVKAAIRKGQVFDVAFQKLAVGIFGARERDQLRANMQADGVLSEAVQEIGEDAGAASEIGDVCPGLAAPVACRP